MTGLRDSIKQGNVVIGALIGVPWLEAVEAAAYAGYDFVFIDTEHGAIDTSQAAQLVLVAQSLDIAPIWRVRAAARPEIKVALDWGAEGILVPEIHTPAEAEAVVAAAKYPPEGERGVGPSRPTRFGLDETATYMRQANEQVLVCLNIETAEAVENIEQIAQVEGIDVFNIGPADLSSSLGIPMQFDHPDLLAAAERVLQVGKSCQIAVGMYGETPEHYRKWVPRGMTFLETVAVPGLLATAMDEHVSWLRALLDDLS